MNPYSAFDGLTNAAANANSANALGQSSVGSALSSVTEMTKTARVGVALITAALVAGFARISAGVLAGLAGAASGIASSAVSLFRQGVGIVIGGIVGLLGGVAGLLRFGAGAGGAVLGAVQGLVGGIVAGVVNIGGLILGGLVGAGRLITGALASLVGAAVTALQPLLASLVSSVTSAVTSALQGVAAVAGPVALGIAGILSQALFAVASRVATTIANTLGSIARNLITIFSAPIIATIQAIATTAYNSLVGAATFVFNTLRTTFTTLVGWAQSVWAWASGLASQISSFIGSNIGNVVSVVGRFLTGIAQFGLSLARFVGTGSVLAAFAAALYGAAQSALKFSESAKSLSAMTGQSLSVSAETLRNFAAQGIGGQSVVGALGSQSPYVFGLKAAAFGLPGYNDPRFGERLATRFQGLNNSGPTGNLQAQAMLRVLGLNGDEFQRLAATSPATQRANSAFSNRINANLGMGNGDVARYAEQIPALLTRVGVAFNGLVTKLASVGLPLLEQGLDFVTRKFGEWAPQIGQIITGFVDYVTGTVLPLFATSGAEILNTVLASLAGVAQFVAWFVENIPTVLAKGALTVANVLRGWSNALAGWAPTIIQGFADFLQGVGTTVRGVIANLASWIDAGMTLLADFLVDLSDANNPFRQLAIQLAGGLDAIINTFRSFVGGMAGMGAHLNNAILTIPVVGPIVAGLLGLSPGVVSPGGATANALAGIGPSNMAGNLTNWFNSGAPVQAGIGVIRARNNARAFFANADQGIANGTSNLANGATEAANSVVNGLTNGINRLADFIASEDGQRNIGRDVGSFLSGGASPLSEILNTVSRSANELVNAATSKMRESQDSQYLRQIAENTGSMKEQLLKTGAINGGRIGTGAVLSDYAASQSAAIKRQL